jgi:hypothetical protein
LHASSSSTRGCRASFRPMTTSNFTETLRQLKLDLAKGTPVGLRFSAAGSQLIRPAPRPQDPSPANSTSGVRMRYPPNLKYAQLDQPTKNNYLRWRTQALQAEQAAVAIGALTEHFSVSVFLGSKPKPQPSEAVARACAHLLSCIQQLPPFDDLRKLYLSHDGRDLTTFSFRCVEKVHREAHESELRAVIAPAAAFEGQLRLTRSAPAVSASAPTPRLHRYVMHHFAGIFNGAETDPAVYFSQDQQAQRLAERQRRAQADLQRHALAARQAQPRQYRRHSPVHARSWQPKLRSPQQCSLPRAKLGPSALPPSLPAKPTPLPDPAAEVSVISTPKAGYPDSDAASAASTIDLVSALLTLLRFVRGTLTPVRRRFTRSERCTMETRLPVPFAATDWLFRTAYSLGRWTYVPRSCRKVRSSLRLHRGCTDGTGTRPSFEPR